MKRKRCITETSTTIVFDDARAKEEESQDSADLLAALQEISKSDNVIAFILKSATRATIYLRDSEEIAKYAILSSQLFDSSEQLSELFNLGETEKILIEGKNIKVFCINSAKKTFSIFMEKNADHAEILKRILSPIE